MKIGESKETEKYVLLLLKQTATEFTESTLFTIIQLIKIMTNTN